MVEIATFFIFLSFTCFFIGIFTCFQEELKKLLLYSTVGHFGYFFLFLYQIILWDNVPQECVETIFFYFLITSFLLFGFFTTVLSMRRTGNTYPVKSIYDLAQLWLIDKVVAICCLILLMGLASVPFFPGFLCRWFFVQSAFLFNPYLGILSLYTSIFTSYSYVRMMHQIFFNQNLMFNEKSPRWYFDQLLTPGYRVFLILCTSLFLFFTFNPSFIWFVAHHLANLFFT